MSIELKLQIERPEFKLSIDTVIPKRGITALFGPSGAGKTSVLRCIAGLERHPARIQVSANVWQDDKHFLPPHLRSVAYVFQEPSLLPHLSVQGNLEYGFKRVPKQQRHIQFDNTVELLGLSALLHRNTEQLSGGQRQRVAIARALLTSPQLLLMDEPLASLDDDSKASILNYIDEVQQQLNIPTLYVTHSTSEIVRLADHLIMLDAGQVIAEGEINELLTRGDLPLAHHADAGVMLKGTVAAHDDQFHLTVLDVPGGQLAVSKKNIAIGAPVRARLLARDISLALIKPEQSSIQNILNARIHALIDDADPAQVLIKLKLDGGYCLARITRRALSKLALNVGMEVFAQVKSVAVVSNQ
ncbi:MAG: molybdenum ABC transporter ATP-binding protein [Porticoccaceae bacterium]